MTYSRPRRPDERTRAQRLEQRAAVIQVIAALNTGAIGSSRRDIAEVYRDEISKHRRVHG